MSNLIFWGKKKEKNIVINLSSAEFAHSSVNLKLYCEQIITKTCLYNFDPNKPYFYIVKLGFTGVYIFFLISAQKHRLWVRVPTIYVLSRNKKNIRIFHLKFFSFFGGKILYIFE